MNLETFQVDQNTLHILLAFPERENYWAHHLIHTQGVKAPWCVAAFHPEQSNHIEWAQWLLLSRQFTESFRFFKLIFAKQAETQLRMTKMAAGGGVGGEGWSRNRNRQDFHHLTKSQASHMIPRQIHQVFTKYHKSLSPEALCSFTYGSMELPYS